MRFEALPCTALPPIALTLLSGLPARAAAPSLTRSRQATPGHAWQTICHPQSAKLWQQCGGGAESRPSRENKVLLPARRAPPSPAQPSDRKYEGRGPWPGQAGMARCGGLSLVKSPKSLQRLNAVGSESPNDLESTIARYGGAASPASGLKARQRVAGTSARLPALNVNLRRQAVFERQCVFNVSLRDSGHSYLLCHVRVARPKVSLLVALQGLVTSWTRAAWVCQSGLVTLLCPDRDTSSPHPAPPSASPNGGDHAK